MKTREETYGERLKLARERAGMSQAALAKRVNVKPQTVQHLEDPEKNAQGSIYTASFALTLGVHPAWLESGTGKMALDAAALQGALSMDALAIAAGYEQLTKVERDLLREFISARVSLVVPTTPDEDHQQPFGAKVALLDSAKKKPGPRPLLRGSARYCYIVDIPGSPEPGILPVQEPDPHLEHFLRNNGYKVRLKRSPKTPRKSGARAKSEIADQSRKKGLGDRARRNQGSTKTYG